jgi:hypothetical protein
VAAEPASRLDAVTPIALSGGTVMAVFLMAVIVLGYVVIWALWHFVFREAGDHASAEHPATVAPNPDDSWSREPPSPGGPGAASDPPADGAEVPRVASGEDDRRA